MSEFLITCSGSFSGPIHGNVESKVTYFHTSWETFFGREKETSPNFNGTVLNEIERIRSEHRDGGRDEKTLPYSRYPNLNQDVTIKEE